MKPKVLFVISILISSFTFVANKSVAKTSPSKHINILMPAPFADSTKDLINKFNVENKDNIIINVTRGPLETESVSDLAISSLMLEKSPFDILLIDVTWLPKYAAAGWLSSLDKWITQEDLNKIAIGAQKGNKFKNKVYRWPFVADMGLLYWRKDLMEKPPRTNNELIKISKELIQKKKVKYGYVWQGRQYEGLSCVFLEVLYGFGGEWLDENGAIHLDKQPSINAAKWLKKLIKDGITPKAVTNYSEPESLQLFESGEVAFMRNWPYAWSELQKPSSVVRGKVGVTTMVAEIGNNPTSTLGSWGFSIIKTSKNPQDAFKVIKYLTSIKSQKHLFLKYGYTPISSEIFKDVDILKNSPIITALYKGLTVSEPRPQTPLYAQISDVLQRHLSEILTGDGEVSETMNRAHSISNQILQSAGSNK